MHISTREVHTCQLSADSTTPRISTIPPASTMPRSLIGRNCNRTREGKKSDERERGVKKSDERERGQKE
jgi:hypothetical protein